VLIAGIALLYAAGEAFGLPVPIPDRRRQVPEWWRWTFSAHAAALLYGLGLGVGFLTYVRHGTLVAVSAVAVASGDPLVGATLMAAFGLARGLSVAVVWKGSSIERVQRVGDRLGSLAEGWAPKFANTVVLALVGLAALLFPVAGGGRPAMLVVPWALALVFGWAGVSKWARFSKWRETLMGYALPRPVEKLALSTVPAAEAAVPVLALYGQTNRSASLALTLLIVFSAAVGWARIKHGAAVPCGCFGARDVRDYRILLLRNAVLGLAAAAVLTGEPGRHLLEGMRRPHLGEALPVALVLVGLVLSVVAIASVLRLRGSEDAGSIRTS
jgi:uncharacterized membrane protein YphA (DoxX/SURF4 family)